MWSERWSRSHNLTGTSGSLPGYADLVPNHLPVCSEKDYSQRCQHLLKCPASAEPSTPVQVIQVSGIVLEPDVALCGARVPLVHGIDGLGQLGAAAFVDAASVDPCQAIASLLGDFAELSDLVVPGSVFEGLSGLAILLEGDFLVTPSM